MASGQEFRTWAEARQYRRIAVELVRLESGRGVVDLDVLGSDPEGALEGNAEIMLEYDTSPKAGCSVFGYYQYRSTSPSVIFVHPALTSERDNFTIVHEFGHHVQRQHVDWANVRHSFPLGFGTLLEERVADSFAAEVLIPADSAGTTEWLTARALSAIYGQVRASRAAVAMRAVEIAPDGEQATIVVTDFRGVVTFARACGDDVNIPERGRIQPGLARLVAQAVNQEGTANGDLSEGLQSGTGWAQHDLVADVALEPSGAYAFAIIRPSQQFGRVRSWDRVEHECPRAACGTVFIVDETVEICSRCSTPKCPDCDGCECEPKATAFCPRCTMQFTLAEQEDSTLHECII